MFLNGKRLYQVLDRCEDLFPEWKREGNKFWNSRTGEIVYDDGLIVHDLVYREREYEYNHKSYNTDCNIEATL